MKIALQHYSSRQFRGCSNKFLHDSKTYNKDVYFAIFLSNFYYNKVMNCPTFLILK